MPQSQDGASSSGRLAELEQENASLRERLALAEGACGYLQSLIDTIPTGVVIVNVQGEITLANQTVNALFGSQVKPSVYNPSDFYSLFHLDGTPLPTYDRPLVRALQHGETSRGVSLLVRYDQNERIIMVGANPLRDEKGDITGAVATIEDVTARHHAEENCQHLLSEREAIFQSVTEALVVYRPDESILRMNTMAERMLLFSPGEWEMKLAERWLVHNATFPNGSPVVEDQIPAWRALHGETIHGEIIRLHPTPESTVWISVSAGPVFSPQGRILGAVATYTDITEQQNYQQERERLLTAIQEQVAELDATITSMPNAVAIYSLSGEIIHTNDCGVNMLGFTPDECRLPMEVRWEHMRAETPDGMPYPLHELPPRRAMQGEALTNIEVRIHVRDETLRMLVSAAPVRIGERIIGSVAIFTDITDLRKAEEALLESERNLARSQAVAHVGDWTWDARRDVLTVSEEVFRILGISKDEFGHTMESVRGRIHPDDQDRFTRYLAEARAGKPQAQYEVRIVRPDGAVRSLLVLVGDVLTEADGMPERFFGVLQDITERKRIEEALRDSEERFRAFSESTSEGIALHENGVIIEVNQTFADHLGYTKEEMQGHYMLEFTAPESREEMVRRVQTEDPGPYEAISLHRDGSRTIGEIRAQNIVYHGRPVRVAAVRDITSRKRAEQALRESEEKFRGLFENMSDAMAIDEIVYGDGRPIDWVIRDVNPAYERIMQIPKDQAVGRRASELYEFFEHVQAHYDDYVSSILRGESVQLELDDSHTGRHLLISVFSLGVNSFATVTTDITERRKRKRSGSACWPVSSAGRWSLTPR